MEKNPKRFWAYVNKSNKKTKIKDDIPDLVMKGAAGNERLTSGCQEWAEALADYFASVFIKELG